MKKMVLKLFKILLILQILICICNINSVSAATPDSTLQNIEQKSTTWKQIGNNKISMFGLNTISLVGPLNLGLGIVHFLAIAFATGKLLLTALNIVKDDAFDKAKAKKAITQDLFILFICLVGVGWVKTFIIMIV